MPKPVHHETRYQAGIDGLRALAVLSVIAYHVNLPWAPGGLLGVGVFFVISGYLITHLLLTDWTRYGHIRFKVFWGRRARRLLPALLILLAIIPFWVARVSPHDIPSLRQDELAALFYLSNWWYIYHHVSYFQSFANPQPLKNLWSLAVEEQFYLLWPLILAWFLPRIRQRPLLVAILAGLALVSAGLMALFYHPGLDPSRVYYGTDTRAFALVIGAILAVLTPTLPESSHKIRRRWWDTVGWLSLVAILAMIWRTNQYQPFLYRGGLVGLSVLSALVIRSLIEPGTVISRVLGTKPLRWIGERSYGIYLWHYPIIVLTTPVNSTTGLNGLLIAGQVALTFLIAAVSWRYIEDPIRRGALRRWWHHLQTAVTERTQWGTATALLTGLTVLLVMAVGGLSGWVEAATPAEAPPPATITSIPLGPPLPPPPSPSGGPPPLTGQGVTAIGDSVMVDAAPYLEELLPGIVVSAHVGRQLYQTPPVVASLIANHQLGTKVIIELGNNGPYTTQQLIDLLNQLGPVQDILLVNARVPRPWQTIVNQTLAQVAATYPHATLVNWYAASANHNNYFYPDGVHLTPVGALAYARLIVDTLRHLVDQPKQWPGTFRHPVSAARRA